MTRSKSKGKARRKASPANGRETSAPDSGSPAVSSPRKGSSEPQTKTTAGTLGQRVKSFADGMGKNLEEMSVRIRRQADGDFQVIAPGTPFDALELHSEHSSRHHGQGWNPWLVGRRILFPLAFLLGAAAVWMAVQPDFLPEDMTDLWPMLQSDMRDFVGNMSFLDSAKKTMFENRDFRVGDDLIEQLDLHKEHPIILMPGIVSTGLESWSTEPVARGLFRSRLWGTSTMIRTVLTEKNRWVEAIGLDLSTGLDPPGHKVRAAQGLDAASEFIQGYWIWQKIVQNLATIGYDTNSMDMAAYDWRLAYYNLEIRDMFFSRLKSRIELLRKAHGKKVVLASHSMGGSLALYFFKWVEAQPDKHGFGGGGGPKWVEDNIEAWVNIAGTLLGVPKAMTAFLSGEMRDTVEIHPLGSYVLEKFFSRRERASLFRSWPGASSMLMKGGNRIWGDDDSAPDDPANATDTYGRFLSFRHRGTEPKDSKLDARTVWPNLTIDEASPYILTHTSPEYQRMIASNYSTGFETNPKQLKANARDHTKWSNPLEVELPHAPSMKIYCLYGHGKETERSYWYVKGEFEEDEARSDSDSPEAVCEAEDVDCERTPLDFPLSRQHWIDSDVTIKGSAPEVRSGVKFSDGDGTIATVSLGAMCVRGWKGKTRWNPAGIEVITQEYQHSPETLDLRGGPLTADHVDILGSSPLNAAILKIAAGRGDEVKPRIGSKIMEYVDKMNWD